MKLETLGEKERRLLLKVLGLPLEGLKCHYCDEPVSYKTCCIMPSLVPNRKDVALAVITCDCPMCQIEYFDEFKEKFPKEKIE